MNVVGKILIGLITLMSVLFMAFSLALYAAHQNWKAKATALQQQLSKERQEMKNLQEFRDRLKADLDAEQRSFAARQATLADEEQKLQANLVAKGKVLAATQAAQQQGMKAMQVAQTAMAEADTEVNRLRQETQDTDKQRGNEFANAVLLTDQLHQTANELNAVKSTNATLIQDLQKLKAGNAGQVAPNAGIAAKAGIVAPNAQKVAPKAQ